MTARTTLGLLLIGPIAFLSACGPASETGAPGAEPAAVEQVGQLLRMYREKNRPVPKSLKEAEKSGSALPKALEALRSGAVVIFWGLNLDEYGGASVIGYEKQTPERGGVVILGDGATAAMTAEQFREAPKPPASLLAPSGAAGKGRR
ncbi:hypothetical protein [Paludisphaera mucosa]|uniref:Uncharacterized protein n=1 Tax=Paludisphaera mucosa TaxID=3030827 RepID=A0ABT6FIN5_9BACT|nr:hypothetical protein [Paludisphaera mucosa]MDG3007399.1 hypothetical protein [Paludisphaera mucosa]